MSESRNRILDCEQGNGSQATFAIVVSRYHASLTSKLLSGSLSALRDEGIEDHQICIAHVPGAWELSSAAAKLIDQYDAVICLGVVVKGDTSHDQFINAAVSSSLAQLGADHQKPIGFGLLTCNTMEQAIARCGGSVGNKGEEAATAALQMVQLFRQI